MIDPTMSFAPTPQNSGISLLEAITSPKSQQRSTNQSTNTETNPAAGMTARSVQALVYHLMGRYLPEQHLLAEDYSDTLESYKQGEDQVHFVTIKRLREKAYSRVVPGNALVLKLNFWPNSDLTIELTNGENWKIFVVNTRTDNEFVREALLRTAFVLIGKPAEVLEENKPFFDLFSDRSPQPKSDIEKEVMRVLEVAFKPEALSVLLDLSKKHYGKK